MKGIGFKYLQSWKTVAIVSLMHFCFIAPLSAQSNEPQDSAGFIRLRASDKYNKPLSYQKKWGKHYRQEWYTPVLFRIAKLDTLQGGLTPYRLGGGRQSESLFLRDRNNREYVLRSIDKSFGKALPEIAQGTFIEKIVDDQVTIGHPYAALTIPPMAEAVKIFHTNPTIYYIPKQPRLGEYIDSVGNQSYLFEQRPDEAWETAANFGYAKKIVSTEKMLENLHEDNDVRVDQLLFVRSRLFDMFIGDWGRHEDQWRWGEFETEDSTVYKPIPRDRDQAYTKFDGKRLRLMISLAGLKHLQTFDHNIKDISTYNFPARNLDYHLTNKVRLEDWTRIAKEMKEQLTDKIIEDAILLMPKEVYPISGPEITSILKSRRNSLPEIAEAYFRIMAKEVEVTGSEEEEMFDIQRLADGNTTVNIYKITKEGEVREDPFYTRLFKKDQTEEIRLYGLKGADKYKVSGSATTAILVRLIGGPQKDQFIDESNISRGKRNVVIHDNRDNEIIQGKETKLKLSSDTAVHAYKYDAVEYSKRSIRPILFFSNHDRIYVGMAYSSEKHGWRKVPYNNKQYLDARYSITQRAISSTYRGIFTDIVGKWALNVYANYDAIRWTNFFGLGNKTILPDADEDYTRMRTKELLFSPGIERTVNNRHRFTINPFYQNVKTINDTARFISKTIFPIPENLYSTQNFAGIGFTYLFQVMNDSTLPTKGFNFIAGASYTNNLADNNSFSRYNGEVNIYLPLSRKFSVVVTGGGTTLEGTPELYQNNRLGGRQTLRGYERDRFHGKSTAYNQNELRYIRDVRSFRYNGQLGLFAHYDIGRVWIDGETSNTWHSGYGAGIIVAPFNRIAFSISYSLSREDRNVHLSMLRAL